MLMTALIAVLFVGGIGLMAMFGLRFAATRAPNMNDKQITWSEYGIALAIVTVLVVPLVLVIGNKMAIDSKLTYQEFYNGVEVSAYANVTHCKKGHSGESESAGHSNCHYTYVSGSYSWTTYTTEEQCSGFGSNRHCTSHQVAHYHSANIYTPYAKIEKHYVVTDSLGGSYTYPHAWLDANPEPYGSRSIPSDFLRGEPADWLDAKRHIDAGDPRSVTRMFDYDNYILASTEQSVKAYSSHINQYKKVGLLPDHTANIGSSPVYGDSRDEARKISFVGVSVSDPDTWNEYLMRFNAALGGKLQGDMHAVVIDANKVTTADSEQYLNALKAYWQSSHFGKRAIAKNAIILVLGVKNGTVTWAKATTGMPGGNNLMLDRMSTELQGQPLDPGLIFGKPKTAYDHPKAKEIVDRYTVTLSQPRGILEHVVFEEAPFARACMKSCPKGQVGYSDLIVQIQPSQGQKNWMIFWICFVSLFFWAFVAGTSILEFGSKTLNTPDADNLDLPVELKKWSLR